MSRHLYTFIFLVFAIPQTLISQDEELKSLENRFYYFLENNYDSCLSVSKEILLYDLKNQITGEKRANHIYMYAKALENKTFYGLSLEQYNLLLKDKISDTLKRQVYHRIGLLYDELDNWEVANSYYKKALNSETRPYRLDATFHALADNYYFLGMYDSSFYYFERAIEVAERYKYTEDYKLQNLAMMQTLVKLKKKKLIELKRKEYELYDLKNADLYTKGCYCLAMGYYYSYKANYDSTKYFFQRCMLYADSINYMRGKLRIYDELIFNAINSDHKDDLIYYLTCKDSLRKIIIDNEKIRRIAESEVKYDLFQKEIDLIAKSKELDLIAKNNLILKWGIFIGIILSVSVLVLYFKNLNNSRELAIQKDNILTLNKELNHRTKNNLQLLSSIIGLQAISVKGTDKEDLLKTIKNRVNSLSCLHIKIEERDSIELAKYVKLIFDYLNQSFSIGKSAILINNVDERIKFSLDKTTVFGLLFNEIITNFFKYGAVSNEGVLTVKAELNEDTIDFLISDNGIDNAAVDRFNEAFASGNKIISTLCRQLNMVCYARFNNGFELKMQYKIERGDLI